VEITSFLVHYQNKQARHVLVNDVTERKNAHDALNEKMNELIRFQHLTVGRELTMIELKKEINELLRQLGKEPKYSIVG
jgi:phosphoglycerate-specific signal transduction histidine kinase